MITFDSVDKFSKSYDFFNRYLRFAHNQLFYKKVHIVDREHIPLRGTPTFVIANHQNGVMDAMAILYLFDDFRQPVFIARGDVFRKEFVAKILRFLKIMPTFRSRDGGVSDIKRNFSTFDIAANILKRGGTLAIFPEAQHQHGHYLSSFKKGFPRIAMHAQELLGNDQPLQILPLNIHYTDYFNFQSELLITVGKPFTISEFSELYKTEPNSALLQVNEKARHHIKALALDIENHVHYEQYELLRNMWHTPLKKLKNKGGDNFRVQLDEDIAIVKAIDELQESDPAQFDSLMSDAAEYQAGLSELNLRNWLIDRKITLPLLAFKAICLLLSLPIFLFGFINNVVPFKSVELLTKKIKDPMLHSSVRYIAGVAITFPICYLIILVVSSILFHNFGFGLLYLAAVLFTLYGQYYFTRAFIKFRAACRYWRLEQKKNALLMRLKALKRRLLDSKIG